MFPDGDHNLQDGDEKGGTSSIHDSHIFDLVLEDGESPPSLLYGSLLKLDPPGKYSDMRFSKYS